MKDINEIMDEIQKNWETNAELISEQFLTSFLYFLLHIPKCSICHTISKNTKPMDNREGRLPDKTGKRR